HGVPVISQTILQSLASMRDEHGAAISVYLDLDPSVSGTGSEASTRAMSMIDHLRDQRRDLGGAAKRRFDVGVQRIHRFLRDEDVRGGHEVHGAALFACGEDTFHAIPLWRSAGDEVWA